MAATLIKRVYQISGSKRASGTGEDFTYRIELPVIPQADAKDMAIVLMGANIPKSWYIVQAGRNTFTLVENGTNITITVPPGNYNVYNFSKTVVPLLNAATLNGSVYAAAFNMINGLYTWTVTPGAGGTIASFVMAQVVGDGLHAQFGLAAGTTTALPFTSTAVVRFVTHSTVQIRTDLVAMGGIDGNANVLQAIYVGENADFTSIGLNTTDIDARSKPLASITNSTPRFFITDEDGNMLNMNGLNMTLTVMIYKPLDLVLRNYIGMRSQHALLDPVDELRDDLRRYAKAFLGVMAAPSKKKKAPVVEAPTPPVLQPAAPTTTAPV